MSTYKLYDFTKNGPGELNRLVLIQGGQQFEDVRISQEDWPGVKEQMPWGNLPVLEVDGKKLAGTTAITSYLGEKLGLAGDNQWDRAQLESIADIVAETVIIMSRYWSEKDPSRKAEKKSDIWKDAIPSRLARINKCIEKNNSPDGYIYGNKVTYADLCVFFLFTEVLPRQYPEAESWRAEADKYPAVGKLCKTVCNLPNIKKYLDSRRIQPDGDQTDSDPGHFYE